MKTVVLVDIEAYYEEDPELEGKLKQQLTEMEFHVAEALRHMGHEVRVIPIKKYIRDTIAPLMEYKPDLVFNLTEHFDGDRRKDMNIAALLEMLGMTYTGTGPKGLMICRDKALCKRVLSHHHVRVPDFAPVPMGKQKPAKKLNFPLIVKPMLADGSEGISLSSLVDNDEDLQERVRIIHERIGGPAICEEYIDGREIYVSVLGNKRLEVLPAREVKYGRVEEGGPIFTTSRVKLDEEYRKKWEIDFVKANLSKELEAKVTVIAKRIFRLLYIRDYGRIDMRLTKDGEIYCLEANPNPDLTMGDEVAESAEHVGMDYQQLIERIVSLALRRQ